MTTGVLTLTVFILIVCLIYEKTKLIKQKKLLSDLEMWHKIAVTDDLTGIYNRAAYSRHIGKLKNKLTSNNFSFAIVIFDIDNFKAINDTYGHLEGDRVLQLCSKMLCNIFTHPDYTVYRIGGDEFAVILQNITENDLINLLIKIREQEKKDLGFKLSKGYSFWDKNCDFSDVFKYADEMLYADKASKTVNSQNYENKSVDKICI